MTNALPQNLDAEEYVLGALMLAGADGPEASAETVAAVLATGLQAGDFFRPSHGVIFSATLAVAERGEPTEVLLVEHELEARGQLAEVDGRSRVRELAKLVPAIGNAPHHAGLVIDAADQREQLGVAVELGKAACNGGLANADPALRERVARLLGPRRSQGSRRELHVLTLDDFTAVEEPGAEALVGSEDGALLSESGDCMVYGDGGVGKTTLGIDLGCHLAAGDGWLGIPINRAVRVLLIENEGPRALYRAKLKRKREGWKGSPLGDRVTVLERPWGKLSLADPSWREALAAAVEAGEVDVVIAGPVSRLGMNEAGTLQEVRDFMELVAEVRERSGRRIAVVLIHHENKGGKVSGAWEGSGDTLLHVQGQGHGRLRLYVQKARWSSSYHAKTLNLAWAEGEGFTLVEEGPARPERTWDDIAAYVVEHGGCAWNEVEAAVQGDHNYKRRRRDAMLAEGVLVNVGQGQAYELWHRDDPARPTLDSTTALEDQRGSSAVALATGDEAGTGTALPRWSLRTSAASSAVGSKSPGEFDSDDEEEGDEQA